MAIALETLAVKAFGDMDPNARLRLIQDRFVAGHENCALRRHLDSIPPETPIWDIVDRCRVWESHADTGARRIVNASGETVTDPGRGGGGQAPGSVMNFDPWTPESRYPGFRL